MGPAAPYPIPEARNSIKFATLKNFLTRFHITTIFFTTANNNYAYK